MLDRKKNGLTEMVNIYAPNLQASSHSIYRGVCMYTYINLTSIGLVKLRILPLCSQRVPSANPAFGGYKQGSCCYIGGQGINLSLSAGQYVSTARKLI